MTTMSTLHITTEPVNTPTKPLIYSLVNGLYKITTESINLILDVEQFGASSDLIVPNRDAQKVSFFLLSSMHPH